MFVLACSCTAKFLSALLSNVSRAALGPHSRILRLKNVSKVYNNIPLCPSVKCFSRSFGAPLKIPLLNTSKIFFLVCSWFLILYTRHIKISPLPFCRTCPGKALRSALHHHQDASPKAPSTYVYPRYLISRVYCTLERAVLERVVV